MNDKTTEHVTPPPTPEIFQDVGDLSEYGTGADRMSGAEAVTIQDEVMNAPAVEGPEA